MCRFMMIGLLLFTTILVNAQDTSSYPDIDKKAFVEIFWDVKAFSSNVDSVVSEILKEAGISNDRYAKIISSGLKGESFKLSDTEEAAISQIQRLSEDLKQEKSAFVQVVCAQHGLTLEQYNDILQTYRSDIAFQQSMRPYFKTYLEEQ